MDQVVDFINVNRDRYVEELKQYLGIPSISALPQHASDVRRAAEWTAEELRRVVFPELGPHGDTRHPGLFISGVRAPLVPDRTIFVVFVPIPTLPVGHVV